MRLSLIFFRAVFATGSAASAFAKPVRLIAADLSGRAVARRLQNMAEFLGFETFHGDTKDVASGRVGPCWWVYDS